MSLEQALQQQEAFRLKKVWAEQKGFLFGHKKLMKEAIQRVLDFYCVLRCSICFIELTRFQISAAKLHVGRQFSIFETNMTSKVIASTVCNPQP